MAKVLSAETDTEGKVKASFACVEDWAGERRARPLGWGEKESAKPPGVQGPQSEPSLAVPSGGRKRTTVMITMHLEP